MLAVFTASASAQVDNPAQITGRVTDASGAALSGVRMRITGQALRVPKEAVADDDGRFAFGGLRPSPATYTVTARLEGFETSTVMVRAYKGVDSSFTMLGRLGEIVENAR